MLILWALLWMYGRRSCPALEEWHRPGRPATARWGSRRPCGPAVNHDIHWTAFDTLLTIQVVHLGTRWVGQSVADTTLNTTPPRRAGISRTTTIPSAISQNIGIAWLTHRHNGNANLRSGCGAVRLLGRTRQRVAFSRETARRIEHACCAQRWLFGRAAGHDRLLIVFCNPNMTLLIEGRVGRCAIQRVACLCSCSLGNNDKIPAPEGNTYRVVWANGATLLTNWSQSSRSHVNYGSEKSACLTEKLTEKLLSPK